MPNAIPGQVISKCEWDLDNDREKAKQVHDLMMLNFRDTVPAGAAGGRKVEVDYGMNNQATRSGEGQGEESGNECTWQGFHRFSRVRY